MKNTELFYLIFRQTKMGRFLISFGIFFLAACFVIYLCDPSITTYKDALWFGFMVFTTIGFGDYTVVHPLSRITAALLGIYGIVMTGFVCGVAGSYLFEKMRLSRNESYTDLLWKLEHLDSLNDDQIQQLQKKAAAHKMQKENEIPKQDQRH